MQSFVQSFLKFKCFDKYLVFVFFLYLGGMGWVGGFGERLVLTAANFSCHHWSRQEATKLWFAFSWEEIKSLRRISEGTLFWSYVWKLERVLKSSPVSLNYRSTDQLPSSIISKLISIVVAGRLRDKIFWLQRFGCNRKPDHSWFLLLTASISRIWFLIEESDFPPN